MATLPVGAQAGDDRKTHIEVYSYTDLPMPEFPAPAISDTAMHWLAESWSTVALIGLVMVSLAMMFSWVRGAGGHSEADAKFADGLGLQLPQQPIDSLELSESAEASKARRRPPAMDATGEDLKEDLSTIIRENPDAAVNLIKAWIGEAA